MLTWWKIKNRYQVLIIEWLLLTFHLLSVFFSCGPSNYSPREIKTCNLKLPSVDLLNKRYLNLKVCNIDKLWNVWPSYGKFSAFINVYNVYCVLWTRMMCLPLASLHTCTLLEIFSVFWGSNWASSILFSSLKLVNSQMNMQYIEVYKRQFCPLYFKSSGTKRKMAEIGFSIPCVRGASLEKVEV